MSSKYGHERRNRQDKIRKEPTGCVGGKESLGLWNPVIKDHRLHLVLNKKLADQLHRRELMEFFESEVRRWRFIVSGYKFMFSWRAKEFANANGLSLEKAKIVFDRVRVEAEDRLRIAKQRMRRAGFSKGYERDEAGNPVEVYSLSLRELPKFLPRDDVSNSA